MKEKYKNLGRIFSEEFRRRQVDLIDRKVVTVAEVCRAHDVSDSGVRKWLRKYSKNYHQRTRVVVEMESEARKNQFLKDRIAELERIVGQKQMKIDYLEKLIEVTGQEVGEDLKKKVELPRLNGSGKTGRNTPGK